MQLTTMSCLLHNIAIKLTETLYGKVNVCDVVYRRLIEVSGIELVKKDLGVRRCN